VEDLERRTKHLLYTSNISKMAGDPEKNFADAPLTDIKHAEDSSADGDEDYRFSGDNPIIKAIKRKTDLRICTLLGALYAFAAIDRVNLAVSYL
jgi:hypothetical protein